MHHRQRFSVTFSYEVRATHDTFAPDNRVLEDLLAPAGARPSRAMVVIDDGVAAAHPQLERRIHRWFADRQERGYHLAATPMVVPGGEAAKRDLGLVDQVIAEGAACGLCRHSHLIAIGGGAMLDAVGLAAALLHRGVRLIRLPTTVLAQNDAGIGVKNGINAHGSKNLIGCFAPPYAVVNDRSFLATLSDRAWRAGISEAFKVAIIKDADFLSWLINAADDLAERTLERMAELIERCARLHLDHIATAGDPFETGSSRPLDFGHWSAHHLEMLSHHRLNHGEAVAIGIALDLGYAVRQGWFPASAHDLVLDALHRCGFALHDPVLDLRDRDGRRLLLRGLASFREHLGGDLTLAMPDGVGAQHDIHHLDEPLLEAVLTDLRRAWAPVAETTKSTMRRETH